MKHIGGKHATTQVGHLIDVATDGGTNTAENWTMYMEICDVVNNSEDGPKEAVKAVKRRFATKNASTINYTLSLLETCVKNCGRRFHVQIATKDFLQDLVKVINPKYNPSMATQIKVLGLIQTWAHAFSKFPELKEVNKTYQELKTKGVEFPPLDPDEASPANIPSWCAPTVAVTEVGVPRGSRPAAGTMPAGGRPVAGGMPPAMPYPPHQHPAMPPPGEMTEERCAKLRTELQTVQQNCTVFGDMLTEVSSGDGSQSDNELLEDLNLTCRQMQKRIMELLQSVQHEQLIQELLGVNDELNNVFLRYDRYQRLRAGRAGMQPPVEGAPAYPPQFGGSAGGPGMGDSYAPPAYMPMPQPSLYDNAPFNQPKGPAAAAVAAPHSSGPAIANLIDFDDMSGSTAHPPASQATSGLGADFANLNLGGGSAGGFGGDDFEALAHSRQTNNSNPALPLRDKESDFVEMQKWLLENPAAGSTAASNESATTLEFERFLSQRQRDAEKLPNVGTTAASTTSGPNAAVNNEPLFSL